MKTVHTVPMEVYSPKPNGGFELEPHEVGWATEALAMVYVREIHGAAPQLELRPQISVDGVRWIDGPNAFPTITKPGGYSLALSQFGNWLRLVGTVSGGPEGGEPAMIVDLYWVLK